MRLLSSIAAFLACGAGAWSRVIFFSFNLAKIALMKLKATKPVTNVNKPGLAQVLQAEVQANEPGVRLRMR
jgi:hypothetical protein